MSAVRGRHLINVAYGLCLVPLIGAPAASLFYTVTFVRARASLGYWVGPEGDMPSYWSGKGPYAIGAPPAVAFILCLAMLAGFLSLLYWSWARGDWNMDFDYGNNSNEHISFVENPTAGIEMKENKTGLEDGCGVEEIITNPVRATSLRDLRGVSKKKTKQRL